MTYLLIITDANGREYRYTYDFRAQADMHGKEWERRAPGVKWEVRAVTGMLSHLQPPPAVDSGQ